MGAEVFGLGLVMTVGVVLLVLTILDRKNK